MSTLLDAILLPKAVSVVNVKLTLHLLTLFLQVKQQQMQQPHLNPVFVFLSLSHVLFVSIDLNPYPDLPTLHSHAMHWCHP